MKAMVVLYEIIGALLLTIGLVRTHDFAAGMMIGMSFGFLGLAAHERSRGPSWFGPFSLAFLGSSFLMANWWLVSQGRSSFPPFITFGPLFLAMGAYAFLKRRLARNHEAMRSEGP